MAERLAGGNVAVALLANTGATVAALAVLIRLLGPISGAHFNPAVSRWPFRKKPPNHPRESGAQYVAPSRLRYLPTVSQQPARCAGNWRGEGACVTDVASSRTVACPLEQTELCLQAKPQYIEYYMHQRSLMCRRD